jgi:hypothetical protein
LQEQYEGIYTDIELDYHQKLCRVEDKSCTPVEKEALVLTHFNKTLHTLRVLMRLLGLDFHFTRIETKYQNTYTMDSLLLLITRCRKMYTALSSLQIIFALLQKKNLSNVGTTGHSQHDRRLMTTIKIFLTEHTLFPV